MIFLWILLAAHLLICLVLLILRIVKIFNYDHIFIFIAFFLPIWGEMILLYKVISDRHSNRKGIKIEVEKPTAEEEKKSIAVDDDKKDIVPLSEALVINDDSTRKDLMVDILYNVNSSIVYDEDEMKDNIVPIEEALVVNDKATRRALIIDVLYSNPTDYISQLYNAKANGDTEVVHYAATALAEIQKEFDLKFQDIEERRALDPNDEEIEEEYETVLENYISSRLLEGEALRKQLRIYSDLIDKKLRNPKTKGRWSLLYKKANADLMLEDTNALDKDIIQMNEEWPDREGTYIFKLKNAILKKDKELIMSITEEIRNKNIYVSSELRSIMDFWKTREERLG